MRRKLTSLRLFKYHLPGALVLVNLACAAMPASAADRDQPAGAGLTIPLGPSPVRAAFLRARYTRCWTWPRCYDHYSLLSDCAVVGFAAPPPCGGCVTTPPLSNCSDVTDAWPCTGYYAEMRWRPYFYPPGHSNCVSVNGRWLCRGSIAP